MNLWGRIKAAASALGGGVRQSVFGGTSSSWGRSRTSDAWLSAYNTVPWLRATVSRIAYSGSTLDWAIKRTQSPQTKATVRRGDIQRGTFEYRRKALEVLREQDATEVYWEHPVLTLLTDMCPAIPGKQGMFVSWIYYEVAGEAFFIVDRGPRDSWVKSAFSGQPLPQALWPIPPTWVSRTPTPDDPTFDIRAGNVQLTKVPIHDVLWHKNPNPVNPYSRGVGDVQSLTDEFDADENAARLISWSFYNRGRPDVLIGLPGAQQSEVQAFRDDWNANLVGVSNALKTHFVNVDPKAIQMGYDFQHLQVLDLRKYNRDMIRQVQGIPPEILGILDQSNRATIDAADYLYNKNVIVPKAEMWREFFQRTLVVEYDPRAVLDYVSPIQEDKNFTLSTAIAAPYMVKVKDWRKIAGLPPVSAAEGDLYMVPAGVTAVRSLEELADAEVTPAQGLMNGIAALLGGGINVPGASKLNLAVPGAAAPTVPPGNPGTEPRTPNGMGKRPRREIDLTEKRLTPDEALAIARWSKVSGYSLDLASANKDAPVPVCDDRPTEYLRRTLSHLRGQPTSAWDHLFGKWAERDDAMMDMMLGLKEFCA